MFLYVLSFISSRIMFFFTNEMRLQRTFHFSLVTSLHLCVFMTALCDLAILFTCLSQLHNTKYVNIGTVLERRNSFLVIFASWYLDCDRTPDWVNATLYRLRFFNSRVFFIFLKSDNGLMNWRTAFSRNLSVPQWNNWKSLEYVIRKEWTPLSACHIRERL